MSELTSFYFLSFSFILINRVKLLRSLPPRFKVDVKIAPGTHASEEAVNKQVCSHGVSFDYKVEPHNSPIYEERQTKSAKVFALLRLTVNKLKGYE